MKLIKLLRTARLLSWPYAYALALAVLVLGASLLYNDANQPKQPQLTGAMISQMALEGHELRDMLQLPESLYARPEMKGLQQKGKKLINRSFVSDAGARISFKDDTASVDAHVGSTLLTMSLVGRNLSRTDYAGNASDMVMYSGNSEIVIYNLEDESLKELIIARQPSADGKLELRWNLSLQESHQLSIEHAPDGGLNIFSDASPAISPENDGQRVAWAVKKATNIDLSGTRQIAKIPSAFYADRKGRLHDLDWNVEGSEIYIAIDEKASAYPLMIDPAIEWGQWLGGSSSDSITAIAVDGDEIFAAGYVADATGMEGAGWHGTASGTEGFVVKIIDGDSPTFAWGQWLGGAGSDQVNAIHIEDDIIYVGGNSNDNTSWEAANWYGNDDGSGSYYEGFVIKIEDGSSPNIVWGQWLGGSGSDYIQALAVTGSEIFVGGYSTDSSGWETITWSGSAVSYEGFVVKIQDNGDSPAISWGQWIGASGIDMVIALTAAGDEIFAGGYCRGSAGAIESAGSWYGSYSTYSGDYEGFVTKITDGSSPTLSWGQWIGGSGQNRVESIAVSGEEIFAVGRSQDAYAIEGSTWYGTDDGSISFSEGFLIKLQDGASPTISWGQWLGGSGSDFASNVKIKDNRIYIAGYSSDPASWSESILWSGAYSSYETFVIEIENGPVPRLVWGQWLGGTGDDLSSQLATSDDEIYVAGISASASSWESMSWNGSLAGTYEGFLIKLTERWECSTCADCNTKISTGMDGDKYLLTANINNQAGNCIRLHKKDSITFDCDGHTIDGDDSVLYTGIYLNYTNHSTVTGCLVTDFNIGMRLQYSHNNNLSDMSVTSSRNTGIYSAFSTNNTYSGITSSSNSNDGITLYTSSGNYLTDIDTRSNTANGIYLTTGSSNNDLHGINASSNSNNGIHLYSSSNNNILSNIDASSNSHDGIYLNSNADNNNLSGILAQSNLRSGIQAYSSSSGNRITDSTLNKNSWDGIRLYFNADGNTLSDLVIRDNANYGIRFYFTADSNNISLCRIENNTLGGMYLDESGASDPEYNTIWNNYINNTNNIQIDTGITNTNYFSITLDCSSGENIVGGPCIGGNFWTNPSMTGFSDTCADDDADGICDSDYQPSGTYAWYDYEPLNLVSYECSSCASCSTILGMATVNDTVNLAAEISDQIGTCIIFDGADDIIFDCRGHLIDGDDSGYDYGIYVNGSADGNIIRDCSDISDFAIGIKICSSTGNKLANNSAVSNGKSIEITSTC